MAWLRAHFRAVQVGSEIWLCRRRHLTESQRAAVAAKLANMAQGERTDLEPSANLQKVSQGQAAEMLNVSTRSVAATEQPRETGDLMGDFKAVNSLQTRMDTRFQSIFRTTPFRQNKPLIFNGFFFSRSPFCVGPAAAGHP